ncbi:MAG: hypothetical protein IJA07_02775 [Agathobacter sp.]|nr:hypothetical protein [Agathobacter sp.]
MDNLKRINELDSKIKSNRSEKLSIDIEIERLRKESSKLDDDFVEMSNSKRILSKEQYKNEKHRRKVVSQGKKTSLPETAILLEPYVKNGEEMNDEILDAFVKMENQVNEEKIGIIEMIDNITLSLMKNKKEGGNINDH